MTTSMRSLCLLVVVVVFCLVVVAGVVSRGQQGQKPSIYADEEGHLRIQAATNKTVFFNELDLVSVISQQQQQLETQMSVNAVLESVIGARQSTIDNLNTTLLETRCRAFNPLPYPSSTYNYSVTTLGQGVRVDYESDYLDVSGSATTKWRTGVLASNGLVYGAPLSATTVLVINPATNEVDTTSISVSNPSGNAWYDVVEAGNGKLYFLPVVADNVLILDPNNDNAVDQTSISGLGTNDNKWYGGAMAPNNNKIYCIPFDSTSILIVDPSNDTGDTTTISNLPSDNNNKWLGAVLANNNMIYGIPYSNSFVLVINPINDTADYSSVAVIGGDAKWFGGVLANNGKIYGFPSSLPKVLVIDPTNSNAVSYIDVDLFISSGIWYGGVLTGNGRVVGIPYRANTILIVNPDTGTVDSTSLQVPTSTYKWAGAVYVPEYNRIYGIPRDFNHILQIDLDPCM